MLADFDQTPRSAHFDADALVATADRLWIRDELIDLWRDAQARAREAYEEWLRFPAHDAYVVYRAEQDRADAAQDALAAYAAASAR